MGMPDCAEGGAGKKLPAPAGDCNCRRYREMQESRGRRALRGLQRPVGGRWALGSLWVHAGGARGRGWWWLGRKEGGWPGACVMFIPVHREMFVWLRAISGCLATRGCRASALRAPLKAVGAPLPLYQPCLHERPLPALPAHPHPPKIRRSKEIHQRARALKSREVGKPSPHLRYGVERSQGSPAGARGVDALKTARSPCMALHLPRRH